MSKTTNEMLNEITKKMYTGMGYTEQGKKIIWDFTPVNIVEFIKGKQYLNLGQSVRQNVLEDLTIIFGLDPFVIAPKYNYAIFSEAVGTGKTFRQAIMALYIAYKLLCLHDPIDYFNTLAKPGQPKLSPDTKLAVILMAVTADNARKVIYTEIGNKLANSPWFKKHYPPVHRIKTERQFDPRPDDFSKLEDRIYKNVYIIPGSSSEYAAVGYNIIMAIIDEATLFEDTKDASLAGGTDRNDQAEIVYATLDSRITSRFGDQGLLAIAGNPKHEEDFLERHAADAAGREDVYIVTRRPVWQSTYPEFDPDKLDSFGRPVYPHFYFHLDDLEIVDSRQRHLPNVIAVPDIGKLRSAFKNKPEIAKRDLAGYPTSAVGRVISDPTMVQRHVNKERENPLDLPDNILIPHSPRLFLKPWFKKQHNVWHGAHFDLAKKGDAAALTISHVGGYDENGSPQVYVDLMVKWQGTPDDEFKIDIARQWIEYLHDELYFDFGLITADTWQSSYLLEILSEKGYRTGSLSVDTSNDPYDELISYIRAGQLDYYEEKTFIKELTNLERRKGKYDHSRRSSKDVSDSCAGSVYNATRCGIYGEPPDRHTANQRGNRAYSFGRKHQTTPHEVRRGRR